MASGMFEAFAVEILDYFIGANAGSWTPTKADIHVAWTTGTASKSSIGSGEISESGYTLGGEDLNVTGNLSATSTGAGTAIITTNEDISWINGGGTAWGTIANLVLHRNGATGATAGTGLYFIDSLSITLPGNATLTIPSGNLSFQIGS